jgi:four helix bundle protein
MLSKNKIKKQTVSTFQDLIVWQKAHQFVLEIYKFSSKFPKDENCGLTSQLRRAAISIPSNIAEGFTKIGKKDKVRFFNISQGSLEECSYYLILSDDLGYGNSDELLSQIEEVSKLLGGYISSILASGF